MVCLCLLVWCFLSPFSFVFLLSLRDLIMFSLPPAPTLLYLHVPIIQVREMILAFFHCNYNIAIASAG